MIKHFLTFILISVSAVSFSQKVSSIREYSGPEEYYRPFGFDQKSPEDKSFDAAAFFELPGIDHSGDDNVILNTAGYDAESGIIISPDSSDKFRLYTQKVTLHAEKYAKDKLTVHSNAVFRVSVNGEVLLENLKQADSVRKTEKTIEILKGDHRLLLQLLAFPGDSGELRFRLEAGTDSTSEIFAFKSASEKIAIDLETITHLPNVSAAGISSDGKLAALTISQKTPPKGQTDRWIELWDVKNKARIRSFRGLSDLSSVNWVPGRHALSYTTSKEKKKTLWLHPLEGQAEMLIEDLEGLASYQWSGDGSFLIFSKSHDPEKKDKKVNLLDGMASRLPGYEKYSYLYKLDLSNRKIRQLTFGRESTSLSDISPDGSKIIFTTSDEDYSRLPYSYSTYWMMNLETGKTDSLFRLYWDGSCEFIPGMDKLLVTGGPSVFGKIGENVAQGQVANGYDGQAYLFDLNSKEVEAITRDLDPSISTALVSDDGRYINFITTNKTYANAFRYSIADKAFMPVKGLPERMRNMDVSQDGKVAVATGNNTQSPQAAYVVDLKKLQIELLHDPSADELSKVTFGEVKTWNFINENNDLIDGRYYLPPDFDSTKSYPLIVYYYGGTTPVSRSFGGRYPYNWYAAQGYVVYILQPRGCIGYGQSFSAEHVNNWGKTTAIDIIEGTKKFLKAHDFINPEAVGCIGASYGGFMTMYLLTQTDIFSAAVSHAGISSLSSYWGEGYWGYAYSAVATQGSFPWNRKDIYVDQSPLFQADKVNTPLLLTHGASDTNVPPGESYQFYAALKLLGKEVEMLEVPGQDHWILDYEKYFMWKYSIMAWFDKHLKKDPVWWKEMYD